MPGADDAADLILRIVRSLVDTPGAVRVVTICEGGGITYRVSVADGEIGQVIGKQGRTARSLRTILAAISMKDRQRYTLDILAKGGSYQEAGEDQYPT
jgi:hypothetical protein